MVLLAAFILSLPQIAADSKFPRNIYHFEDVFICLGLAAIAVSGILHPNEKMINYLIAYFYIFGVGYLALKYLLYEKTSIEKIFKVNVIAVLFVAAFVVFEVFANLLLNFDVQSFIPRLKETKAGYLGIFSRAYAFATESGTVAFYFNTLGVLALWKLWNYRSLPNLLKVLLTGLLIIAWGCTFSAGGLAFIIISVIIVLIIRSCDVAVTKKKALTMTSPRTFHRPTRDYRPAWNKLAILAELLLIVLLIVEHFEFVKYALNPIISKITLQKSSVSAQGRLTQWNYAIDNIFDNPFFGKGIGYLSSRGRTSSINWYLFLSLEAGLIAAFSFILFLLFSLIRILKSETALKYWFMAGFLAGVFNFSISSTIFNPFLWILIALFNVVLEKQKIGESFNMCSQKQYLYGLKKRIKYARAGKVVVSNQFLCHGRCGKGHGPYLIRS